MDTLKPRTKKAAGQQYSFAVYLLRGMRGQLNYLNRIRWIKETGLTEHLGVSIDNTIVLLRAEYLEIRDDITKER